MLKKMFQKIGTNLKNTNMQKVLTKLHLVPIGRIWFWISKGLLKKWWIPWMKICPPLPNDRHEKENRIGNRKCARLPRCRLHRCYHKFLLLTVRPRHQSRNERNSRRGMETRLSWRIETALQEVRAEIAHERDAQRQLEERARQLEDHPALRFPVFFTNPFVGLCDPWAQCFWDLKKLGV